MNNEQFVFWLKGFLEGRDEYKAEDILKIEQKLKTVNVGNLLISTGLGTQLSPYISTYPSCDIPCIVKTNG